MYETNHTPFYKEKPFFAPYIYSVWHVRIDDEGPVFNQNLRGGEPNNLHSIFRTYGGKGYFKTKKAEYVLTKNTLLLLRTDDIISYSGSEDAWEYTCYNFVPNVAIPLFQREMLYSLPVINDEQKKNEELLNLIKSPSIHNANYASSLFCSLLFSWGYYNESRQQLNEPYYQEISECISFINENLSLPLKITDLAKRYNLSERTFQRAFIKFTGVSPKNFIISTKIKRAVILLQTTNNSIQAIAEELGYYSPFQFSRDFKKHYEISPLQFRSTSKFENDLILPPTKN